MFQIIHAVFITIKNHSNMDGMHHNRPIPQVMSTCFMVLWISVATINKLDFGRACQQNITRTAIKSQRTK